MGTIKIRNRICNDRLRKILKSIIMNIKHYISSELLELYVYGALSEKENAEIYSALKQYPEIEEEIKEVKTSLIKLTSATASYNPECLFNRIKEKLNFSNVEKDAIPIRSKKSHNWASYMGWGTSILLLIVWFIYSSQ